MKLIGVIFVLLSAFSVGIRVASGLRKRCEYLERFIDVLCLMSNELSFMTTPLPFVFLAASEKAAGNLKTILLLVAEQMEKNRWMSPETAVEIALNHQPDELIGEVLKNLAGKLGSYDVQAQLAGIDAAVKDTERLLQALEVEMSLRSKTYKTLSICAGLALVILLI